MLVIELLNTHFLLPSWSCTIQRRRNRQIALATSVIPFFTVDATSSPISRLEAHFDFPMCSTKLRFIQTDPGSGILLVNMGILFETNPWAKHIPTRYIGATRV